MKGAMVSLIGVFEQGFYDQLGFGTGGYEHLVAFDPAKLNVASSRRIPKRLNKDDYANTHQSRLQRMHSQRSLDILPHEITHSMIEEKKGFGVGFYDGPDGSLIHHMWLVPKNVERGPYFIWGMAYQSYEQFLELLSVLKSLGDQVHLIRVLEPQGIQFQDLLKQPLKERFVCSKSNFEIGIRSLAYWQIRICDLQGCINRTHLHKTDLHFNLVLEDPITKYLSSDPGWQGLSGNYVIHLGSHSSSEPGQDPILATLKASIGAFSRMWIGIRPSSGLSVTDNLSGPPELLAQLDDAFQFPNPKPDWDF